MSIFIKNNYFVISFKYNNIVKEHLIPTAYLQNIIDSEIEDY